MARFLTGIEQEFFQGGALVAVCADGRTSRPRAGSAFLAGIDGRLFLSKLQVVTATHVIRQMKRLPAKERSKVFAYVDAELERQEQRADRKAVADARQDPRPPVAWEEAKKRLGLA